MDPPPFLGLRASQSTPFTVIWTAFIQSKSAILNTMAAQMTQTTGVGVEHTLKRIQGEQSQASS